MIRRALFVGLGGVGQRHLRNLRALRGRDVEVLAFRSIGRSQVVTGTLEVEPDADVEERYGVRVFRDLRSALEEGPDVAFICNPSSLHLETALAAVEAGCHLFVEKPLSHSLAGVDALVAAVESRRRFACVGYQLRFHPLLRRARELLRAGAIGRPLSARLEVGEYLPHFHRYEDYRQMYASRRELGGGVVLSQIHELDYAGWLFGAPRRVFAIGGKLSDLEIDVEDVASVLLDFGTADRVLPVHVLLDFVRRPPQRRLEVVGSAGVLTVDLRENALRLVRSDGGPTEALDLPGFDRNELFLDEMRAVLDGVERGSPPAVSLREGAGSLAVAVAVLESMATGAPVDGPFGPKGGDT